MFLLFEISIQIFASVTKIWPTLYDKKVDQGDIKVIAEHDFWSKCSLLQAQMI